LKVKLKGRHFDTVEVTKADSQAVLNSLTEHGIQDAFKYWQKRWERAYLPKRTSSRAMVASRPKVSFYQMAAPVPENLDDSCVGEKTNACKIRKENLKEIDYKEDSDVGESIILKWVLEKHDFVWIGLN
jgi:hypothetical protein